VGGEQAAASGGTPGALVSAAPAAFAGEPRVKRRSGSRSAAACIAEVVDSAPECAGAVPGHPVTAIAVLDVSHSETATGESADACTPVDRRSFSAQRKWSPSMIPAICEKARLGISQAAIARYLGVSPQAMSKWMQEHPALYEAYHKARVEGMAERIRAIQDAMSGGREGYHDWKADAWLLEEFWPEECGSQRHKMESQGGSTTSVSVTVVSVPAEKLKEIQGRRAAALGGQHGRD